MQWRSMEKYTRLSKLLLLRAQPYMSRHQTWIRKRGLNNLWQTITRNLIKDMGLCWTLRRRRSLRRNKERRRRKSNSKWKMKTLSVSRSVLKRRICMTTSLPLSRMSKLLLSFLRTQNVKKARANSLKRRLKTFPLTNF